MTEEQNVIAEEQEQEVVHPEEQSDQSSSQEESSQKTDQEYNWRQLRETKRQLEEENRLLRQRMEAETRTQPEQESDDFDLPDDELVEGRHVKQLMNKMQSLLQQQEAKAVPDRLKSRFSDFDAVVTPENVERLKQEEPELLASIMASDDLYSKGAAAYKLIKRMSQEAEVSRDKAAAEINRSRPGSSHGAARQSALSDADRFANGLTPELRRQLQREMEEAARAS
ncbi:MAG: hypothetical protein PVF65_12765 [Sphingomonadales bacterium]|jgi:hypothetical protein